MFSLCLVSVAKNLLLVEYAELLLVWYDKLPNSFGIDVPLNNITSLTNYFLRNLYLQEKVCT